MDYRYMRYYLFLILLIESRVYGISVEEAYKAIPPHQQTYNPVLSSIKETKQLHKFFTHTDQALVLRIESLQAIDKKRELSSIQFHPRYAKLKEEFSSFEASIWGKSARELIIKAIDHQKAYLEGLEKGSPMNIHIQQSSQALHQLYHLFMQSFPNEAPENKDSFFQHLCALDFI